MLLPADLLRRFKTLSATSPFLVQTAMMQSCFFSSALNAPKRIARALLVGASETDRLGVLKIFLPLHTAQQNGIFPRLHGFSVTRKNLFPVSVEIERHFAARRVMSVTKSGRIELCRGRVLFEINNPFRQYPFYRRGGNYAGTQNDRRVSRQIQNRRLYPDATISARQNDGSLPSMSSATCKTDVGLGRPDLFAEGAARGTPHARIKPRASRLAGILTATVSSPAVTLGGSESRFLSTIVKLSGQSLSMIFLASALISQATSSI